MASDAEIIDTIALKMFITEQKLLSGAARTVAEAEWRKIGPTGRKHWRDLAAVAYSVIKQSEPKKSAAAAPGYKPPRRY